MQKANLLLVEDSKIMASRLKQILQGTGDFNVSLTVNGAEALKKLKEEFYPIILTDLLMPEMDGFQLIEQAKNSGEVIKKENIDQIFVVVSSLDQKEDIQRAISLGAYDVMPKPMDEGLLLAKMKNYYRLYLLMLETEKRYQDIRKLNSEIMDSYENRILESQALTGAIEEQNKIYTNQVELINQIRTAANSMGGSKGKEIIGKCNDFLEMDNLGK